MLLAVAGLLSLVSCSKYGFVPGQGVSEEEEELCGIEIGTKGSLLGDPAPGDYTSTTYRAQLFYRGSDVNKFERFDSLKTPYVGTYCDPKGSNSWLTPCAVDAVNYAYDAAASPSEGSEYGLRAGRYHDYYLFINSPATPYVKYAETTKINPVTTQEYTMEYWGLPYSRGGDAKDHPAVSPAINVTTAGVNLQNSYLYNVPEEAKLVEYRSRIAFSVRCGDAISHANFKRLRISGLRSNAVFRPFTKDFYFSDLPANIEAPVLVYESPEDKGIRLDRGGTEGSYTEGESRSLTGPDTDEHLDDTRTNEYFTYVLCGDYKSLDKNDKYINTPADLLITLVDDEGNPINLDPIPLSFIFEPQKSYFYLITVNSVYLHVEVYALNWSTPIENSISIDDPNPLSLTISISDWTTKSNDAQVDPGQGGDDAEKYDKSTEGITTDDWNAPTGGSSTID